MDIKFDKKSGRILSCTIEGKIEKADNVITISDEKLPNDFMVMFPLGKYLIKNEKIISKKGFKIPQPQSYAEKEETKK